jgi:hypothetical protein
MHQSESLSSPSSVRPDCRVGLKADVRTAKRPVRSTPNSDRESEIPQNVMSALLPKADMCGALVGVRFGLIADIDHVSHSDPGAEKETAWWRSPRNLVKRFAGGS